MPVPLDLLDYPQWLVWRYEKAKKGDKPTKVPCSVTTKQKSGANNPATWASYDDAVNASEGFHGIGFAFTQGDPFTGIDLDNCRDKATGDIAAWAWVIIGLLSSYTEVSPSGTGVHIIVRGVAPDCRKSPVAGTGGSIEMYDRDRYFTVTGNNIQGTPDSIHTRQNELDAIYSDYFNQKPIHEKNTAESHPGATENLSADELIEKIAGSAQGQKFQRLMSGDTSGYYSPSEAHQALFSILAWWSKDPEIIKAIAMQSALADHPKFQRDDYLDRSINNAIEQARDAGYQAPASISQSLTDTGNAERLVRRHGEDIRYCYVWNKWLIWDGTRWQEDTRGEIERMAKETARAIYHEAANAPEEQHRQIAKWAIGSLNVQRLHAMIELAKSEVSVAVDALDSDPWLLNVQNGTIDLRTGGIRPPRRADFITKISAVEYHSNALCPQWLAFVNWAMCDDAELIAYLQKALGYGMTGDISEHAFFVAYGQGGNGKTTLFGTIQQILGDYADSLRSDSLMVKRSESSIPNDIAALKGQRFIVSSEGEEGQRLAESLVKSITGGDLVKARFLRAEFFTFKPTHKIFFFTNKKPVIRGTDEGIWRRIHLIPFDAKFTKKDKQLPEKLLTEDSGILNWLIAGCLAWHNDGLEKPDRVESATEGYRSEMDVLKAFLADCCYTDMNVKSSAKEIYNAYTDWCNDNGEHRKNQRNFGLALKEKGFTHGRYSSGDDKGRTFWSGIGLLDVESQAVNDSESVNDSEPISNISYTRNNSNPAIPKVASQSFTDSSSFTPDQKSVITPVDANAENSIHCRYLSGAACPQDVAGYVDDDLQWPMCAEHLAKVNAKAVRS